MTASIRVDHVTKTFRHPGGAVSIKDALVGRRMRGSRRPRLVALDDVTLEAEHGRTLGLIGPNGAGKSTLLRLIGGVGRPDRGTIAVDGRLSALLEIGTGFHPDLTGREATVLAGVIAGLSKRDVRRRLDEIVAFAGLAAFIDDPLRVYSSGMQARLAFAIAVHTEPDIVLVDEVLAVGDRSFQRRCLDRLREFQRDGATVVLVSHDEGLVTDLCDRVAWLQGGRVLADGAPSDVVAGYLDVVRRETEAATVDGPSRRLPNGASLVPGVTRFGSLAGTIENVRVLDRWQARTDSVHPGDPLTVEVDVRLPGDAPRGELAVRIVRVADGLVCVDSATSLDRPCVARLVVDRLDLTPGTYDVAVGLYAAGWSPTWDLHQGVYALRVTGAPAGAAVIAPPCVWEQDSAISATNCFGGWGA